MRAARYDIQNKTGMSGAALDITDKRYSSVQTKQANSMARLEKQIARQDSINELAEFKQQAIDQRLAHKSSIVIDNNRRRQEETKSKLE